MPNRLSVKRKFSPGLGTVTRAAYAANQGYALGGIPGALAHAAYQTYSNDANFTDVVDMPNQGLGRYNNGQITWRAKRMTGRKRKRLHRQHKHAIYTQLQEQQPQVWLRTKYLTNTTNVGEQQMLFIKPLYSIYGTNNDDDDVFDMLNSMTFNATGQTWPAISSALNNKIAFQSARQEVTISNTHVSVKMYVDIYKYYFRKDYDAANVQDLVTATTPAKWSAGGAVTSVTYGVTPFDLNTIVERIKITSKEEVQIEPGQTYQISMTNRKRRIFDGMKLDAVTANGFAAMAGWTQGFLIVYRGATDAASIAPAVTIAYTVQNKYNLKLLPSVERLSTVQSLP